MKFYCHTGKTKLNARDYLKAFRDDWIDKPKALPELFQDWKKNFGGTNKADWDEALNDKPYIEYVKALSGKL